MMRRGYILALCALAFLAGLVKAEWTLEVSAGKHTRRETPVLWQLPASLRGHRSFTLKRVDNGTRMPVQILAGKQPVLAWLLQDTLPAGKTRRYHLIPTKKPRTTKEAVTVKHDGKRLQVTVGEKPVLVYRTAVVRSPNRNQAYYDRSGYIHPLYNPRGQMVTDDFAPDHPHQHGIMFPWTRTTFEGRSLDFWNQKRGQARVEHVAVKSQNAGPVVGEFVVHLRHSDITGAKKPKPVLSETWRVRVYNLSQYYLFDLESIQSAVGNPLHVRKYHYGAMAIRGPRNWLKPGQGDFLTSEGKTRKNGNHTRPRWVDIHGKVDGKSTGVTIFCHPDNFRFPQPVRLHPTKPYFCFAPMVLGGFKIGKDRPYVSGYRFYVHNDKLDVATAERLWQDFADPVKVAVVGKKGE